MRTLRITALVAVTLGAIVVGNVASAAPPSAGKDDATSAKDHYKRGTTLYDLNRFDEAVKEFEAAYELKDDPVLLYNIAQSYRLANKYPEALRFYRNYLRRSPKAANRSEVEQKIEDMEKLISEQNRVATAAPDNTIAPGQKPASSGTPVARPTPATPPPVTPPPARAEPMPVATTKPTPAPSGDDDDKPAPRVTTPPPTRAAPVAVQPPPPRKSDEPGKPGKTKLIAGIVVAALGLGAVGAGVAFGLMAQSAASDQAKAAVFDPALETKGKQNATIGLALDAAGGAMVAVGVGVAVWGALQKPEKSNSSSHNIKFTPALGKSYAGGALSLAF